MVRGKKVRKRKGERGKEKEGERWANGRREEKGREGGERGSERVGERERTEGKIEKGRGRREGREGEQKGQKGREGTGRVQEVLGGEGRGPSKKKVTRYMGRKGEYQ